MSVTHGRLKAMPHVTISSTMAFNIAKIASSACIVMKSSTISLCVAGYLELSNKTCKKNRVRIQHFVKNKRTRQPGINMHILVTSIW